ncbi:MAG: hypothetical protein BGN92_09780 [Sphingobacteriales bacterium 41-5]|nr:MAG: hypothetical protein BGN92_09780 [Sphingobacteriales bacterium 41-5]
MTQALKKTLPDISEVMTAIINEAPEHDVILERLANDLQAVNFYERNGFKPLKRSDYIVLCIDEVLAIAKEKGWQLAYQDRQVYLYNGEYWRPLPDDLLKHFLAKAALKMEVEPNVALYHKIQDEFLKQFYAAAYMPPPERKNGDTLINLKNGTFRINETGRHLQEFKASDFLKYQLPFNYKPGATCEMFIKYLNHVLPDMEKQKVLQEFIASIFISKRKMKLEKVLVLYGDGANGKSVFSDVMRAMLGEDNVSGYGIGELCANNSYTLPLLQDKLLNYAPEFNGNVDIERFKAIATGEPQGVRRIFREPYMMTDYARLAFNCNVLPKNTEQSEGFFRRFLIVEFDVTIPEQDRDLSLATRIIDNELAGVFNWMLEGLDRLLTNGKITACEAVSRATENYRKDSDNVACWLEDQCITPGTVQKKQQDMYNQYRTYCIENGFKQVSNVNFSKRLKRAGFNIERRNFGTVVFVDNLF